MLVEFVEAGWVVLVTVVDGFPSFPKQAVGLVNVGGVSVVSCVVVDRGVGAMVVLDVPVVIFDGAFTGVLFMLLFGVLPVFGVELRRVVVEVINVGHICCFDFLVVGSLSDLLIHVSGVVVHCGVL